MKTCTFFGHRDCPDIVESDLRKKIEELIQDYSVDHFYVGNHGKFDRIVCEILRDVVLRNPRICCEIVLAYIPKKWEKYPLPTVIPEGIENVLPRFAISKRNVWMIQRSDIAVTWITKNVGGAAKYAALAKKKGIQVFNLADKYKRLP